MPGGRTGGWLIDTMVALVYNFYSSDLVEKMAHWSPFEEEVPSCG